MRADDVYRFVTLRQAASLPPTEPHDPLIGAYSHRSVATAGGFRAKVTNALTAGDVPSARTESAGLLVAVNVANAWALLPQSYARLFLALPDFVRRNAGQDLETAIVKVFDADFKAVTQRAQEIADERERVANYLTACSLTGLPNGDFDGAAHILCCFETLERFLATADPERRTAWRLPVLHGVIALPFELRRAAGNLLPLPHPVDDSQPRVPIVSSVAPVSFIGDLIVLKQQLRRYELGEIAHVENVMTKEHLDRTHRTLRRTETKLLTIDDTEKEVARDQQSTTRDELSSEIQKSTSEQVDLSINFDVSATYLGPAISVTASVGGSAGYRRAFEERTTAAVSHSQEVISRASEKVRQRTLNQREKIETAETEQTAKHEFNNATDEHVVGIYRWLERMFDMHLVNYGRRLIYEFVVPEPASYWTALVAARGDAVSGRAPELPELPPVTGGTTMRALTLDDFSLKDTSGALDRPARWSEIVELAGKWGVELEDPPPARAQVHFALEAPGKTSVTSSRSKPIFDPPAGNLHESDLVSTAKSQEPMRIPAGYRAVEGRAGMKGWRYVREYGEDNIHRFFESGYAHLQLNGKDHTFDHMSGETATGGTAEVTFATVKLLDPAGQFLEGEVPVLLTTNLNGLTCSIRLDCDRTDAHALAWSRKMFSLFAGAYTERLSRYQDDRSRSLLGNGDWAGNVPAETAREIERRELKRTILMQMTHGALSQLGDAILTESTDPLEPVPKVPKLTFSAATMVYEMAVRFFEQAFDWKNLGYSFAPYFYGRRNQWTTLAVADNADAQFKAFLSAGAARVQVPIRRGYEAHVSYYFAGLGLRSFEQRVPWLGSMRPIAEDLAADAREGFDIGAGKITVAAGSDTVTGDGTIFRDPEDVDREIRLAGKIYVIKEVHTATELRIAPPYAGTALSTALTKTAYELGGIVVGPVFPLKLPTTLVVIDKEGLTLPEFPGRYVK